MKVLLDTCALIWFLRDDPELTDRAAKVIEDPETLSVVSTVSIWEIAVKASIGKLQTPEGLETTLERDLEASGFTILPVYFSHAVEVLSLPMAHRDPFDRLLIAQCRIEGMVAVTDDSHWQEEPYDIRVLW